ncbi:COX assembly mitochondrial protein homolog [Musca domestica]|uniref:COX assembly mitochondrial protein n=1 Tax=Musca domestica TaxID=7370 RepID=A0A1I8MEK6_MUSDO|nr:COX assembly mitochondrial protein homolog [Musca domestica]XP_058976545.1 COX assembly mitochondrial protein homolog [Musca domestica]
MNVETTSSINTFDPKDPHGLGDPNDKSLRKVEVEILIPKIMRDRAKEIHCTKEVADFQACCKDSGVLMVVSCRKENSHLKECLSKWYKNEAFKEECKQIYLKERSEFRSTGIPKKHRVEKV